MMSPVSSLENHRTQYEKKTFLFLFSMFLSLSDATRAYLGSVSEQILIEHYGLYHILSVKLVENWLYSFTRQIYNYLTLRFGGREVHHYILAFRLISDSFSLTLTLLCTVDLLSYSHSDKTLRKHTV